MSKRIFAVLCVLLLSLSVSVFAGGKADASGDAKGKVYKIGVIPKFIAEDYFIACERGFRQAEKEMGGKIKIEWIGDTMAQCSAANQKNYIQGFIDKRFDAILVSALDPESFADTLKAARAKGIKVITWDSDVNVSARDYFVNQAESDQIAIALFKGMAGDLGSFTEASKATVALVSTTNDSPNQNAWIKAIIGEYNAKKATDYKHINLLSADNQIVYAGNDQGTADEKIKTLLSANKTIKGIIALSSNTVPAVSTARDQLGISDTIKIIGLAVPEGARKDMQAGKMSAVVLWQPFDLGYLSAYVAYDVLTGKTISGTYKSPLSGTNVAPSFVDSTKMVNYPAEGHKVLANNVIIMAEPLAWNLKNIDAFRGYPKEDSGMAQFRK